jgi:NAD(P)-dependent dehydrogenase (short-subunit alcohol dehydrogenase family)
MRFKDLTILVTGGTGGLGSVMVRKFAKEGGRVAIADLDQAAGEQLAADVGNGARFLPLDVTDEAAWRRALDVVDAELGGLDIVINNAGFFQPNIPLEEMPVELWRKHFAVNSDGVFLGCKHGILRLKKRGSGAIVNIGSSMSIKPHATSSAYCASKAAVLMTTRTAAASAGQYNIRVNAVLPGPVKTQMLMKNIVGDQHEGEFFAQLKLKSPLGRLTTPEEVAHGVLFLADPANTTITGIFLPIDGGNGSSN